MTHKEILTLYDFDQWANDRILDIVASLSEEQYAKDLGSSHGGIHGTLVHSFAACKLWLERLQGNAAPTMVTAAEITSFTDLRQRWSQWRVSLSLFLNALSDSKLQEVFSYKDTKGDSYSCLLTEVLQHLVNHSTYHRGQVVTLLRLLGVKPISSDMIYYYRALPR